MADDESLREALLELKLMREREALALRESTAIIDALAAITELDRPGAAIDRLLSAIANSLSCDVVIHVTARHGGALVESATDSTLVGAPFPDAILAIKGPTRVADTRALGWWSLAPASLAGMRSAASAPIALPDDPPGAIVCLAADPAHFGTSSKPLLARLTAIAAQALRTLSISERNTLLAGVIDGSSASVAIADARADEMPLLYVNDAFVDLSGYTREAVLGQNCRFLSAEPPDSAERTRLRQTLAARGHGTFVLRNAKRSGEVFWNRLTLYPIRGPGGEVEHMVATQVDITAERAADAARREAETRLTAALSATSEGFLLVDSAGRIVFANHRFAEFYGERTARFTPGAMFLAVWAERLERLGTAPQTARTLAAERLAEMTVGATNEEERLPDGRIVLRNDRPLEGGGAVSIATDITSLKATERMLAQRAAAIDATQDGIAITDEDGRYVYMNAAHLALFGYENEWEILGQPWTKLYEPAQAAHVEKVGLKELALHGKWRSEVPGRARDGSKVEQEVSLTLLEGIGLVCLTRDVSERHRNERERARLREQLSSAQRQEAVGQLAAGVAHDFNNLLSVITTSAGLISEDIAADHPARAHLERIMSAGARATGLVGKLLESGRRPSAPRAMDLVPAIGEAAELLSAGVPARLAIAIEAPAAPVTVEADPGDVLQVVLNLGINARDAMGQNSGEIRIRLAPAATLPQTCAVGTCEPGTRYAALCVSDTGPGMPDEVQRNIFKPYYTTKGDSGTGLGLAVVASIVRKIGGGLTLQSGANEGTTFTVYWPITRAEPAIPQPLPPAVHLPKALKGQPIIVCDDVADVAEAIAAILETAGAEVAVCEDPRDALAAITEDPAAWSLLITDYDMPQMDGGALARAAREVRAELPIILCTALADRHQGSAPFDATVPKPVDPERLLVAAASAIAGREPTPEEAVP